METFTQPREDWEEPLDATLSQGVPRSVYRAPSHAKEVFSSAFRKLFPIMGSGGREMSPSCILSLVCSLGYLSFRAYNDPTVDGFEEYTKSANRLRYLNYSLVENAVKGVLKIHLKRARNVLDSDFGTASSDPYAVFSTEWSQVASEYVENDCNPVWDSTHYLLIKKNSVVKRDDSKLSIRLFDSDWDSGKTVERDHRQVLIKDDPLGSASMAMTDLLKPGVQNWELPLHLDGDERADKTVLVFSTEFLSFKDACKKMGKREGGDAWMNEMEDSENEKCKWARLPRDFDMSHVTFQPVAFVNAVRTGTQVWIHANTDTKALVVAFRGTEMTRFKDLVSDFRCMTSKLQWRTGDECKLQMTPIAETRTIRFHDGFKRCYDSIWETVMEVVYDITKWNADWTICVTGHSLGGAVATLCAFEFANRRSNDGRSPRVIMMNFGAPRVGNKEFARVYGQTMKESYRVINQMDIIQRIPCFLSHVNKPVEFDEQGNVRVCGNHLTKVKYGEANLKDRGLTLPEGGKKKLSRRSLFKTPGFKGHFETYYFSIITRAVASLGQSDKTLFHTFIRKLTQKT